MHLNTTEQYSDTNASQLEDPTILAESYMMYKISKYPEFSILFGIFDLITYKAKTTLCICVIRKTANFVIKRSFFMFVNLYF